MDKTTIGIGSVLLGFIAFLQSFKDSKVYLGVGIIFILLGFVLLLLPKNEKK